MFNRILSRFQKDRPAQTSDEALTLRAELQAVKLELREAERNAARLTNELESVRSAQKQTANEAADRQVEAILRASAAPAAQLLTQAYLVNEIHRPVQTGDVINVARRLVSALEEAGLHFENQPGEAARFDPDHHIALSREQALEPGDTITVRIPGTSYRGAVLTKAGVERSGEQA